MQRLILLALLCGSLLPATAQKVFDFNTACQAAYHEIVQLKLATGQQMLDAEKQLHPDNLVPYFLENYIDFFTLFFNEDPAAYKNRIDRRSERLELMQQGPEGSPFYLYTQSVIHFQWAAVRVKFGHNWDAGWEFRRAYLQIKENLDKYPDFSPNLIYNGAMQVAVGTIPDGYKWLGRLLGMRGDIHTGMKRLEHILGSEDPWSRLFRDEATFYYLYLKYFIQNERQGVFDYINRHHLDCVNNHLFAYLAANLSINFQHSQKAVTIMEARNPSPAYLHTPVWDLEMGYARLNHLDADAGVYLTRFTEQFKGKFYRKDALQKLSWFYYLQGDQEKADYYRQQVLKQGSTDTEADKQAQKEAETTQWPDKLLLKARLLNDGGYHREALLLLYGKVYTDYTDQAQQLEFGYRVARIYDDMGQADKAISYYKLAILLGEKRSEYYAARAALQLGLIEEQRGNKNGAIGWYRRCLAMKDHDYKNSLDQRAKAGIARCSN